LQVNGAAPAEVANVIVLRMVTTVAMTTITTMVLMRNKKKILRRNKKKKLKRSKMNRSKRNKTNRSRRNKTNRSRRNRMMMARSLSIALVNVTPTILLAGKLVTCVSMKSLVLMKKVKTKSKHLSLKASIVKMFATVTLKK